MSIKNRHDADVLFAGLLDLAKAGVLKSVRQVFKEMKNDPVLKAKFLPNRKLIEVENSRQYCADVAKRITLLGQHAPHLWPQTGGSTKDPADPWLIAVASAYNFCVVTNENRRSLKKIPAACKIAGTECECISGPHFFYETNIVTEIDPAHISPADFFDQ